jgi:hypothetical protein
VFGGVNAVLVRYDSFDKPLPIWQSLQPRLRCPATLSDEAWYVRPQRDAGALRTDSPRRTRCHPALSLENSLDYILLTECAVAHID